MPIPALLAPVAGAIARGAVTDVATNALEKLTGGAKSEEKSKPEEKSPASSTSATF